MVRVTTIKINLFYIRIFFMLTIFAVCLFVLKTAFLSGSTIVNKINTQVLQKALQDTIAIKDDGKASEEESGITKTINGLYEYLIGFSLKRPETILNCQISAIAGYDQKLQIAQSVELPKSALDIDENNKIITPEQVKDSTPPAQIEPEIKPIETVTKAKGVTLINETNYNIDINSFLSIPLKIKQDGAPQVLIYHTHTCEAFTPSSDYNYTPSDTDRTIDLRYTVVKVGDELANTLKNQYGINVIHDKTIHDGTSYNSAYNKSLNTLQGYIKKYPSLSLIIDLHRDAAIDSNGRKLRVITKVDGKPVASVMTVIGSDGRGLPHPNWRENLKLGARFIKKANDLYPGLGRGVNLKLGRFNQFLSKNAILLEVGANGNTLDEAIASTKYIAKVISDVLKEAK